VARYGPGFTAIHLAMFLTLLTGVALTDLRHYLIPDGFTVTGLLWTLGASLVAPFVGEAQLFAGPYDAFIGACAGAGLIAVIGWLGEAALKKEAMGMGDMTLMAFAGAALGPTRAIATVFVGATIGAIAFLAVVYPITLLRRGRVTPQTELALGSSPMELPLVPFGVFLAPAAVIMLFWGDWLLGMVMG
jgi:leader peptidase (prepilin peptidase)/N-methyltransferase